MAECDCIPMPKKKDSEKNPAAVALGRLGGKAAAEAGAGIARYNEKMTAAERSENARRAVAARWSKTSPEDRSKFGRKLAEARRKKREQE